jgi:hypothetical protein
MKAATWRYMNYVLWWKQARTMPPECNTAQSTCCTCLTTSKKKIMNCWHTKLQDSQSGNKRELQMLHICIVWFNRQYKHQPTNLQHSCMPSSCQVSPRLFSTQVTQQPHLGAVSCTWHRNPAWSKRLLVACWHGCLVQSKKLFGFQVM